jgi:hypothetical protein
MAFVGTLITNVSKIEYKSFYNVLFQTVNKMKQSTLKGITVVPGISNSRKQTR